MNKDDKKKLHIVMYHYVRDLKYSRYPEIKGMDWRLFKQQLEFFSSKFNVVTMEQVIAACNEDKDMLPDNALLLTFDDGYIDNYTYALPLLSEYRMQGSFFIPGKTFNENKLLDVNKIHFILATADSKELVKEIFEQLDYYRGTEYAIPSNEELYEKYAVANRFDNKDIIFVKRVLQTGLAENLRNQISSNLFKKYVGVSEETFAKELYMSREQIRQMKKDGMFIGLHGYDHYWMGNLPEEQMKADFDKSVEVLSEFIDDGNYVLNYPYGNYNDNVLAYMQEKKVKLGMTTEVAVAKIGEDNKYLLPRLDCNDFPPKSEQYLNLKE